MEGKGCWVTDSTGRKFFDANAGMWFQNVGYGRKEIADAVYEQLQRINYAPPPTASEPALRLAAKVASLSPDKKVPGIFLSAGGSEAVESALKMAKAYHRLKGKPGPVQDNQPKGLLSRGDIGHPQPGWPTRCGASTLRPPHAGQRSRNPAL